MFKVALVGAHGVGKTSLLQQFMTSEYMGAMETSFGEYLFDVLIIYTCYQLPSNNIFKESKLTVKQKETRNVFLYDICVLESRLAWLGATRTGATTT